MVDGLRGLVVDQVVLLLRHAADVRLRCANLVLESVGKSKQGESSSEQT